MEPERVRVRELFFDRFVAKKAEALRLKEESPLDYMPFIVEEFYRATGICLHELLKFTRWIRRGSYFHGLLVERGQVQECPHLIGAELPKWPQPKPSESHQDSYTRAEGPVAGSSQAYCSSHPRDSYRGAPCGGGSHPWPLSLQHACSDGDRRSGRWPILGQTG